MAAMILGASNWKLLCFGICYSPGREQYRHKACIPHRALLDELMSDPGIKEQLNGNLPGFRCLDQGGDPGGWLMNTLCPVLLSLVLFQKQRRELQSWKSSKRGALSKYVGRLFSLHLVWNRQETSTPKLPCAASNMASLAQPSILPAATLVSITVKIS